MTFDQLWSTSNIFVSSYAMVTVNRPPSFSFIQGIGGGGYDWNSGLNK